MLCFGIVDTCYYRGCPLKQNVPKRTGLLIPSIFASVSLCLAMILTEQIGDAIVHRVAVYFFSYQSLECATFTALGEEPQGRGAR